MENTNFEGQVISKNLEKIKVINNKLTNLLIMLGGVLNETSVGKQLTIKKLGCVKNILSDIEIFVIEREEVKLGQISIIEDY